MKYSWASFFQNTPVITWVLGLLSCSVAWLVAVDDLQPSGYNYLFVLPLAFGIVYFLFSRLLRHRMDNLAVVVIVCLYFFRYVVLPWVMVQGHYATYIPRISNITSAICLMTYEIIVVFTVLACFLRKRKPPIIAGRPHQSVVAKHRLLPTHSASWFHWTLFFIFIFLMVIWFIFPEVRKIFASAYNGAEMLEVASVDTLVSSQSSSRPFLTLFTLLFGIARILFPVYFFLWIRAWIPNDLFKILVSFLIILLQFFFVNGTAAIAIYSAFINLLVLIRIYPKHKNILLQCSSLGTLIAIVLFFIIKASHSVLYTGETWAANSELLQAYFNGVANVQAVFNMDMAGKWRHLFYDLYYTIPFNGTLFGLSGETSANVFNASNAMFFQIIPCVGQAWYYFGFTVAPFIPAVFAAGAARIYDRTKRSESIWNFTALTLFWLYLAITPTMYNAPIFLSRFTNTILPCLLLTKWAHDQTLIEIPDFQNS